MSTSELNSASWQDYLTRENLIFESVQREVLQKPETDSYVPLNRYLVGSPSNPFQYKNDWNRSYILMPQTTPPVGVVVLLHGLTDSPYSLRHIGERYRMRGFATIGIRLPGHGTVPAGLTNVQWEQWMAATQLAIREARRLVPAPAPLHLVGFSNGGALAMKYALDAIENPKLAPPSRIILLTPMIGITRFARFAGFAGLPAVLPAFARAAWLSIVPEFNPFKYNSFPVNGARQSFRVTDVLQRQIQRLARADNLNALPPILTFQSVVDFTVSTAAIFSALYVHLPDNGSEIVLFDVNRNEKFTPLLRPSAYITLEQLTPSEPQPYRFTAIVNTSEKSSAVSERSIQAGQLNAVDRPLPLAYPENVFSLSHLAIPMPMNDPLFGLTPDPDSIEEFGFRLGTTVRGERGTLIMDQDFMTRLPSNPFFPYLLERIDQTIDSPSTASGRNLAPRGSRGLSVRIESRLAPFIDEDAELQQFIGP
jgi:alpha-beta hydrolase superfamily lysophospholipase